VADGMWVTAWTDCMGDGRPSAHLLLPTLGNSVWVTVWVTLCSLRCVGDDVGDGMWVTLCNSRYVGDGVS